FLDEFDIFFPKPDKPVDIDTGKIMILLPRAIQVIEKAAAGKQSAIEFAASRHTRREKKIISGGYKPGKCAEKPHSQLAGKINRYFIRKFLHFVYHRPDVFWVSWQSNTYTTRLLFHYLTTSFPQTIFLLHWRLMKHAH